MKEGASYRILIADDEPITRIDIREILEEAGHRVVGEADDGFDAVEICKRERPDLALLDIKMPLLDGLQAARMIRSEVPACGILLLTAYSTQEYVAKAADLVVEGYLVKPVKEASLLPMVEVALAQVGKAEELRKNEREALQKLEERKLIERAKAILMKRFTLDEDAAYKQLRDLSMNKRCSMAQIAGMLAESADE